MGAARRRSGDAARRVVQLLDEQLLGRRGGGRRRGAGSGRAAANLGAPANARRRYFRSGSGNSGDEPSGGRRDFLSPVLCGDRVVDPAPGEIRTSRASEKPAPAARFDSGVRRGICCRLQLARHRKPAGFSPFHRRPPDPHGGIPVAAGPAADFLQQSSVRRFLPQLFAQPVPSQLAGGRRATRVEADRSLAIFSRARAHDSVSGVALAAQTASHLAVVVPGRAFVFRALDCRVLPLALRRAADGHACRSDDAGIARRARHEIMGARRGRGADAPCSPFQYFDRAGLFRAHGHGRNEPLAPMAARSIFR